MTKFVDMEVARNTDNITITQTAYSLKACKEAGIDTNRRVPTPSQGAEDGHDEEKLQKSISFADISV
jgi:hypothetical protein